MNRRTLIAASAAAVVGLLTPFRRAAAQTRPATLPNAIAIPPAGHDRLAYLRADGSIDWLVPAEGGNVVNRPALAAKVLREGDRWADWKLAGAPAPATQPTPPPRDPNGVYVEAGQSWVDAARTLRSGQTLYLPAGEVREGITDRTPSVRLAGVRIVGHPDGTTIRVPDGIVLFMWCWDDVSVHGVAFRCDRTTSRAAVLRGCQRVTFDACDLSGFVFGATVEPAQGAPKFNPATGKMDLPPPRYSKDITFHRCRFADNHPTAAEPRSSGLFANFVDGLTLTENEFVRNGWDADFPGSAENQGCYIAGGCSRVVVRRNVFAESAGHGLQARAGGIVEDNVFANNPTHLTYGLVNGAGPIKAGGVSGGVRRNVFVGTRVGHGTVNGVAIVIGDNLAGPVDVTGNTIALAAPPPNGRGVVAAAIKVDVGRLDDGNAYADDSDVVGVNGLTVADNRVSYPAGVPAYWINPNLTRGRDVATRRRGDRGRPLPKVRKAAAVVTVQPAFPAADPAVVAAARARLPR